MSILLVTKINCIYQTGLYVLLSSMYFRRSFSFIIIIYYQYQTGWACSVSQLNIFKTDLFMEHTVHLY